MNLTTDDADGKIRLDQYLAAHLPELSRSRIQNLIKSGDVLVNGSPAKPKNPVSRGDSITVRIPEPEPAEAQPQDIPLDILYEDEDVVVINKESGMVVHPAAGNPDGTIVNALLHHCGASPASAEWNAQASSTAWTRTPPAAWSSQKMTPPINP